MYPDLENAYYNKFSLGINYCVARLSVFSTVTLSSSNRSIINIA